MCLSYLSTKQEILEMLGKESVQSGWKIFFLEGGKLTGALTVSHKNRPIGEWIDEKYYRECGDEDLFCNYSNKSYPLGWHIYLKEPSFYGFGELDGIAIRQVEFEDPQTWGFQPVRGTDSGMTQVPVVVAKKMKIL